MLTPYAGVGLASIADSQLWENRSRQLTAVGRGATILEMEYRVTVKSNPRILILFSVIALIPLAAVLLIVLWSPIAGVILLAIGGYVDYHLIKFARLQLASYVRTDEDGIRGLSGISEKVDIEWDDVTHAGVATESGTRAAAFVYAEGEDQLITVPSEYENFEHFVTELGERFDLIRFELDSNETLTDRLKTMLVPEDQREDADPDSG